MSDLEAINAYRHALERIVAVRNARLKTRKQTLKSELQARLTPQGLVSRFPITALSVALGIGWFAGRLIGALITPPTPPTIQAQPLARRSRASSQMIQTLKDLAFQSLTNFVLNKSRDFLVNRLNESRSLRVQTDTTNLSKPSSATS